MTDASLLSQFAHDRDQVAFTELVQRYLSLVYSAALRHMRGDGHQAEDIAQQVFVDLAKKAGTLVGHPSLIGWLYATTRLTALQTLRSQQRRTQREQKAELMPQSVETTSDWEKIQPLIDDALATLNERERRGILIRYFSNYDFRSVGEQLGVSENAAQKLVRRALDQLQLALTKRGITSSAAALAIALENSSVAAPVALAPMIIASASAVGAAAVSTGVATLAIIGKVVAISTLAAAAFGVGLLYHHAAPLPPAPAPEAKVVVKDDPRVHELESKLRDANRRAELAEQDSARLLSAIQQFRDASAIKPLPSTPPSATVPGEYAVHLGDTGSVIAKANNITMTELRAYNPDVNWGRLTVGQVVRVQP